MISQNIINDFYWVLKSTFESTARPKLIGISVDNLILYYWSKSKLYNVDYILYYDQLKPIKSLYYQSLEVFVITVLVSWDETIFWNT